MKNQQKSQHRNPIAQASSVRLALENRLLFDGAVVASGSEVLDNKTVSQENGTAHQNQATASKDLITPASDFGSDADFFKQLATDSKQYEVQPSAILTSLSAGPANSPNLIIVDSRVEGLQQLLANPPQDTLVRVIDANQDGYQQIAQILDERPQTTHLEIYSGQQDGKQWLGSSVIASRLSLDESLYLADWGNHLFPDTEVRFHGEKNLGSSTWLANVQALTGGLVSWTQNDAFGGDNYPGAEVAPSQDKEDPAAQSQTKNSLVFVDTSIEKYQDLLKGIDASATVILLDSHKNEVEQMTQAVSGYDNISAIHIISHGSAGQLKLGGSLINLDTMQGQYANQLALIKQHLTDNADIFIYGCDFGKGALGQQATNLLAELTGADVIDSTNATGSASLGGDWLLERQTGVIENQIPFSASALAAFQGLLDTPVPKLTLTTNQTDALIGSNLTFTATFDNTATTGIGYAPFIDLLLPVTGKDGAGAQVDDGVNFVSATYLGQSVTSYTITFDAAGNAKHPLAKNNTGAAVTVTAASYGLQPGDKLVVLELPFGSYTADQPAAPVLITASLSNLADVAGNTSKDLKISARAGFRFGQDSSDNPTTDPTIFQSVAQTLTVHPTAVTLTQAVSAVDSKLVTGPNSTSQIVTSVTPGAGLTFTNFDVTQTLPDTMMIKAISPGAGGTVTSLTLPDGTVLTATSAINAALSAGTFLQSYTVRYATLNAPQTVGVDFYIPQNDYAGNPILNPVSGDARTITIAPASGSGSLTPIDTRDAAAVVSVISNAGVSATFQAQAITILKTVTIQTNTGAASVTPGDTLEYNLKISLSDYFAFGKDVSGSGSWLVNDVLGDGQTWKSSFTPTLSYTDSTGSHSVTLVRGTDFFVGNASGNNSGAKAANGKTYLQFDLANILTRLQGDLQGDSVLNGASTVTIVLRSTPDDAFTNPPVNTISEGDIISNDVTVDGTLLNNGLALTGQSEPDTSSVQSIVKNSSVNTAIIAINGVVGAPTTMKACDVITVKLSYDLTTGDYENFKLKSFLPLPLLMANDPNTDGVTGDVWGAAGTYTAGGSLPAVGQWMYGAANTNPGLVTSVVADGTANSLTFNFGNYSSLTNNPKTVEIIYSIMVGDLPFVDGFNLALLAQATQDATPTRSAFANEHLIAIKLAQPDVFIKTGVVSVTNPGASVTGATGTWQAAGTAGSSLPFSGTITTASAVDGNLTNFDAGDTIRLATAVENKGGRAAFDVSATVGALPAGLSFIGGSLSTANLKVARGDGSLLSLGTDYSVSGNIVTFLDNNNIGTLGAGHDDAGVAVTNGSNVAVITYDVQADATVKAAQNFVTNASLTHYAACKGDADISLTDLTDSATELVATPTVTKVFQGGTITSDDSSSASTTGANLVVGESMLYDIKVTLPEGSTQSLRIDDLIPAGMRLDTAYNAIGYQLVTTAIASGGSLTADFNGAITVNTLAATPSGVLGTDGIDARLTFSATTTAPDNIASNNTFVIRVRLIVDNIAANQAATTLINQTKMIYSDVDGNATGVAVDVTVGPSNAPVITLREPVLVMTNVVDTDIATPGLQWTSVDAGDVLEYTVTITNPSGVTSVNAYDLMVSNPFPSQLSSITLMSALKGATNVSSLFEITGNTLQTLTGTAGNSSVNLDIAPGESIVLVVRGTVNSSAPSVDSFVSTPELRWTSMDSANNLVAAQNVDERTGAGGVLNDYHITTPVWVNVVPLAPSLSHVGGLADTAAPSPTTGPETVAIAEIVRYRVVVRIPEGANNAFNVQANLPSGLSYINDGTTKVGLIANEAGITSSIAGLTSGGSLAIVGNGLSLEAADIVANLSNGPTAVLATGQIDTSTAQAPVFNLGDLSNIDSDADAEFVVIEFNARVDNIVANDTADAFNVNILARIGTLVTGTSNTVVENVVEPKITNLTKVLTAFNPAINSTTGQATITLSFSNTGDGAANNIKLTDSVISGSNYTITSVTIGGISYAMNALPAGVMASTASAIAVDFTQLAIGTSVSVVYTVEVPTSSAIASSNAVVTYSSLPESFTGFAGSSLGADATVSGERDGSGGVAAPNSYMASEGAGIGIISGTLWDDSRIPNGLVDTGETRLAGQTVTLIWAGADGNIGTGSDNLSFTTTTDSNGSYHFGALPAGVYRITGPNSGGTISYNAQSFNVRYDSDGLVLGKIDLNIAEAGSASANIGYVQLNDAPVNTVVGAQTVAEDNPLLISGLSVADSDAGISIITMQLSVLHGALAVVLSGSATISAGANNSGNLTISGTQNEINATLTSLSYTPTNNFNGSDTLTVLSNDKGNTGDFDGNGIPSQATDARTDTDTVAITVTAVDDAPVNTLPATFQTNEDTSLKLSGLAVVDVDAGAAPITVTLSVDAGTLTASGTGSVTVLGSGTGTLILTGAQANINSFLSSVASQPVFVPVANANGAVTLTMTTNDLGNTGSGGPLSDIDTAIITVTPVNDPPVIDLNSATAGTGYSTSYQENGSGVTIVNSDIHVSDIDNTNLSSATVVLTNAQLGDVLAVGSLPAGITAIVDISVPGKITVKLTGTATVADYQTALQVITFNNSTDLALPAQAVDRSLNITVNDGIADSNVAVTTIAINLVPDPVDDAFSGNEDSTITGNVLTNDTDIGTTPGIANPLAISTAPAHGTLTSFNTATGAFVYTPDPNYKGSDSFIYSYTDADGDSKTATVMLTVNDVNDAPAGTDNTVTINEDAIYSFSAADFGFTDLNDSPANTLASVLITSLPPANQGVLNIGGIAVTPGQELTLAQIATLTFTPAANINGSGLGGFSFQVRDNGGIANGGVNLDPSPNTFQFDITPVDDPLTITNLNNGSIAGTDGSVLETDLAAGSNPSGTGETLSGSFNISAPDGIVKLNIAGTDVSLAALTASASSPVVIPTAYGSLVINGFNTTTGEVNYTFTLNSPADHSGNAAVSDVIALNLYDTQGDSQTATLNMAIIDDAPIARNDIDEVVNKAGKPSSTAYGNVITANNAGAGGLTDPNTNDGVADTLGADALIPPVTGVVAGTGSPDAANIGVTTAGSYGSLILNADGSYTYTPDFANPAVSGLTSSNSIIDTFTYQITDSDGDTSTATLKISIFGIPAIMGLYDGSVAGTDGSVLESDLNTGSNAIGAGEVLNGSFSAVVEGGAHSLSTITVASTDISAASLSTVSTSAPILVNTSYGVLAITGFDSITGVVNYTYTLISPANQANGAVTDDITVSVTDALGDTGTATLRVAITDDVPVANADTNTITEDTATAVTGDVTSNDALGADTKTNPVTGVVAGSNTPLSTNIGNATNGDYGSLLLNADGTYSYTLDNANPAVQALAAGQTVHDVFTYQITDSDGSTMTATLTIDVTGGNDSPVAADDNSDALEASGVANDKPGSDATGNVFSNDNDVDNAVSSFMVTDIRAGATEGAGTAGIVGSALVGVYGTLTMNIDGSYNYVIDNNNASVQALNAGDTLTDSFNYTLSDGSGGSDTAVLNVTINGANDHPVAVDDTASAVEAGVLASANIGSDAIGNVLSNDTDIDNALSSFTVTEIRTGAVEGLGNAGTVSTSTMSDGTLLSGSYGSLWIHVDGRYDYIVDNNNSVVQALKVGESLTDSFNYTMNDGSGGSDMAVLTITINGSNDQPIAVDDAYLMSEDDTSITLTPLALDTDGEGDSLAVTSINHVALTPGIAQTITVAEGVLEISADGLITFTPKPDYNGTVTIAYEISDGHGGTASANQVITVSALTDIVPDALAVDPNTSISYNPILGTHGASADSFASTAEITAINGIPISIGDSVIVANGTVTLGTDNILTFTPTTDFTGTTTYSYTVTSGGVTETATETLFVRPQIKIDDVTVDESAGTATFTVTLSTASADTITVNYGTSSGSATHNVDFTGLSGQLTFAPGVLSQTITVPISEDTVFEGTELFNLNLLDASNATIVDNLGLGTINDNDLAPKIDSVSSPSVHEGGNLDFVITLSNPSATPTTVTLTPASSTAALGTDTQPLEVSFDGGITFVPLTGTTVDVPAGATGFIVRIPTLTDLFAEGDETVLLGVSTPNTVMPVVGTGTIIDTTALSVSISDAAPVAEGGNLSYTVSLNGISTTDISIPVSYSGRAADGSDFTSVAYVIIPAGSSTGVLTIPTLADNIVEGAETITVNLGKPTGQPASAPQVTVADGTGVGVIIDNTALTVSISDAPIIQEGGKLVYTVTMTGTSVTAITIPVTFSGTAADGIDYTQVAYVTIPAGSNTGILSLPTIKERLVEATETVEVTLGLPNNPAVTVNDGFGLGNINDTNLPPVVNDEGFIRSSPDSPIAGNVLSNDSDPNGDALTVTEFTIAGLGTFPAGTKVTIPNVGSLIINPDGSFIFNPKADYQGSAPLVTYKVSDGTNTQVGTLSLTISAQNTDNIGALILLANPKPALSNDLPSSQYSLSPFREPDSQWSSEEPSHPSRLSWTGELWDYDLYLTGSLRNQVVLEESSYTFYIPLGTFRHSNPNEPLKYEATRIDGSPLPDWLRFDPKLLRFSGVPPKGSLNEEVMVKASDRYGKNAFATFKVTVNKEVSKREFSKTHIKPTYQKDKIANSHIGKVSFNDQVGQMGKLTWLMESRALIDSLSGLDKSRNL